MISDQYIIYIYIYIYIYQYQYIDIYILIISDVNQYLSLLIDISNIKYLSYYSIYHDIVTGIYVYITASVS